MENKMVEIENVSFRYGRKNYVFQDFSLEIGKGEIVGLLGENAVGKSTLLYLISGLLRPLQGKICVKGIDVCKRKVETLGDIFLVPEEFDLPNVSLKRYINLNAPFYPKFSMETMYFCLDSFGLTRDSHLKELSMGQKKKVYMCFALATNASLLLMDEPTNGLDIPSKSHFRQLISSMATEEKTIVISTHQVRDLSDLLDHIVMMCRNEVLLNQSVEQITDRLLFEERTVTDAMTDVLYSQPSALGRSIIRVNVEKEANKINLEALFQAMLSEKEKIQSLFIEK